MRLLAIFAASAAIAIAAAPVAAEQSSNVQMPSVTAPGAPMEADPAPMPSAPGPILEADPVQCLSMTITGSRLGGSRICARKSEWDERRRHLLEKMRREKGIPTYSY